MMRLRKADIVVVSIIGLLTGSVTVNVFKPSLHELPNINGIVAILEAVAVTTILLIVATLFKKEKGRR